MAAINPSTATKNDMIVALVQKELLFNAMLAPLVTNVSQFAVKGNKSVEFPKLTSFTAGLRAFGTAGVESVISESTDVLNLDQNLYIAYIIDTSSAIQSSINWEMETAKRASSAIARAIDTKLVATLESVGTPVGVVGDVTKAIVIEMRRKLMVANADMNAVVFLASPDQEAKLLNIDEFTRNDVYGQPVNMTGMIGRLYGVPVIISNSLASGSFYMFDKAGIAMAFQRSPAYGEAPAIEYGVSSVKRAIDTLWGVCGLQLTAGVSPLVVKHGV